MLLAVEFRVRTVVSGLCRVGFRNEGGKSNGIQLVFNVSIYTHMYTYIHICIYAKYT